MNKVILIGRLTKDASISVVGANNTPKATFTLAVNREYKKDEADFINCTILGKKVDSLGKYLTKGIKIAVTGAIRTSNSTKDGVTRYYTDINVDRIEFVESKHSSNGTGNVKPTKVDDDLDPISDDDIPF